MNYLSFPVYKERLGGRLNEIDFTRAEFNARKVINSVINKAALNRLESLPEDSEIWETLEYLTLELIERSYLGKLDGNEYTSQSNDGRSVSLESNKGKAEKMIREYLSDSYIEDIPLIRKGGITTAPVVRV